MRNFATVQQNDPYGPPIHEPPEPPRLTPELFSYFLRGRRLANLGAADETADGLLIPPMHWQSQVATLRAGEAIVRAAATRGTVAPTPPPEPEPKGPSPEEIEAAEREAARREVSVRASRAIVAKMQGFNGPAVARPAPTREPEQLPADIASVLDETPVTNASEQYAASQSNFPPIQQITVEIPRDTFPPSVNMCHPDVDRLIGCQLADHDDAMFLCALFGSDLPDERDVMGEAVDLDALRKVAGMLEPRNLSHAVWICHPAMWLDSILRIPQVAGLIDAREMEIFGRPVLLSTFTPRPKKGHPVVLFGDLRGFEVFDTPIYSKDRSRGSCFVLQSDPTDDGGAVIRLRVRTAGRVKSPAAFARLRLK